MVQVSYPGVYIQELSSGVRTIVGVSTSIAAFVDFFPSGPFGKAVPVFSFADFERQFGGLDNLSESSYAIQQFFLNGGSQAYVVRISSTDPKYAATTAAIALGATPAAGAESAAVLTASAQSPGVWGNNVRLEVDYAASDPTKPLDATKFNLALSVVDASGRVTGTEIFRNLAIAPSQPNDVSAVVNATSQLVSLTTTGAAGTRPACTGTVSGNIDATILQSLAVGDTIDVNLNGGKTVTTATLSKVPASVQELAQMLQALVIGATDSPVPNATVGVVRVSPTQQYLVVKAGTATPSDVVILSDANGIGKKLAFAAAQQNVQQYVLGAKDPKDAQLLPPGADKKPIAQPGGDGTLDLSVPEVVVGFAGGLIGDPAAKSGVYALLDVDLFNILCIPATMNLPDKSAAAVATAAIALCTQRRAMYLLDVPQVPNPRDTLPSIMAWLDGNATLRSRNAALYFPRVDIADPLAGYRSRPVSPSGTVAGLWARTDGARGVWKAPAGTEASLSGVQKLEYKVTDSENGVLNPLAINCLRVFPIYGPVCWGARTLFGADQMADDYKYIPIRRLALFIEESLFRGTQWVVFEPNDVPLWAQIRLNVGAFMQTLFRQGAFQGSTPQDAYYVRCDASTNPQATIDLGIVNIQVGFAPLKPAEFVVITIQQIAGQLAA